MFMTVTFPINLLIVWLTIRLTARWGRWGWVCGTIWFLLAALWAIDPLMLAGSGAETGVFLLCSPFVFLLSCLTMPFAAILDYFLLKLKKILRTKNNK